MTLADTIQLLHDYDIDPLNRLIILRNPSADEETNEVGFEMADRLIKNLSILDRTQGPITILLNSVGGSVTQGFAIYDAIKNAKNHVTIEVSGDCLSMATIILQAADERVLNVNSCFMIHHGSSSYNTEHVRNIRRWVKWSDNETERCLDIYMDQIAKKHKDFPRKKLMKMLDFDTIMSAQYTVDLGLADRIK